MRAGPAPMGPPLDPTADEARRWAQEELSKAIYEQGPSLLSRVLNWLGDLWASLTFSGTTSAVVVPLIVLAAIAAVVTAALLFGGPVRRRRLRSAVPSTEVLADEDRDAAALRASADAAAAMGDYGTAVLDRFRSLVRSLDERGVLTDRQGRTAHEAATDAGAAFPAHAADVAAAGALFDEVRYGSTRPTADQDTWLRAVVHAVDRARPSTPAAGRAANWSAAR